MTLQFAGSWGHIEQGVGLVYRWQSLGRTAAAEPFPGVPAGAPSVPGGEWVEEGEVVTGDLPSAPGAPSDPVHRCHAALNLALFEALSEGGGGAAFAAADEALQLARGESADADLPALADCPR